jgi:hypothetical protein
MNSKLDQACESPLNKTTKFVIADEIGRTNPRN